MRALHSLFLGALAAATLPAPILAGPVDDASKTLTRVEGALSEVEATISDLERRYRTAVAQAFRQSLERRLLDGLMLYDLRHYDKAVVVFAELADEPTFKSSRDYWMVQVKLADALRQVGNPRAAARTYASIVDARVSEYFQPALAALLDIALMTRDYALLNRYYPVLDALPASQRTPGLVYAYGKALYFQDALDDAAAEFERVAATDAFYARAQYYLGVVRARQGANPAAVAAFQRAAYAPLPAGVVDHDPQDVRALALLGMGRVHEETGSLVDAIQAYQKVPRHTRHYPTALYEMAWAFVKATKYDRALDLLDSLGLIVDDDDLKLQAAILRGRLSIYSKHFDEAEAAYADVVQQFTPLKNELLSFMDERQNVRQFFHWLMVAEGRQAGVERPLSERAMRWMRADGTMRDLLGMFDEIREQKGELDEFDTLIARMRARLDSDSAMEIFPNLAEAWYAVSEAENRLIRLASETLDAEALARDGGLPADARARIKPLRAQRRTLEEAFASIPLTIVEYGTRRTDVSRRYDEYDGELKLLEQSIRKALEDLDALETWAQRNLLGTKRARGGVVTDAERQLVKEVRGERERWGEVLQRIGHAREAIEVARVTTGMADVVMKSETNLKNQLIEVQGLEASVFQGNRGAGSTQAQAIEGRAIEIRRRLGAGFRVLAQLVKVLDTRTAERVQEARRDVDAEDARVKALAREVAAAEGRTLAVSEEIGEVLFKIARDEIRDVVLEADLGLIDLAWQQKQEITGDIRSYNEVRGRQIQQIDENLKAILGK